MKKIVLALLTTLLAIGTATCGALATTTSSPSSAAAVPGVVTFVDPVLEAMVCGSMGKPNGKITLAEAQLVTRMDLSNEWQRYISDKATIHEIDGLEVFENLESLDLSFNEVTNITPLSGLKKLVSLSLGGNPINDIAPLAEFTSLKVLTLSGCAAQDYSPLSKLFNLQLLMLDNATAYPIDKSQVFISGRLPYQ
jgi:Leucine-rich repeat (LRR) protein